MIEYISSNLSSDGHNIAWILFMKKLGLVIKVSGREDTPGPKCPILERF